jgi:beta-lactamase superfamily II metal-dependent hydrolase
MKIEIFDVEHGQCAMIHCPNGKKLMIDAGHNGSRPWFPSLHFFGQEIEKLVITNYDQDHTSDLVDLRARCGVKAITANRSISSQNLAAMKAEFGMSAGIRNVYEWLQWLERQPGGSSPASVDLGSVVTTHYWNQHGPCRKHPH